MTKPSAVHFRTKEQAPPNHYHQACTGFFVMESEYFHTMDVNEVTCGNCRRTLAYLEATADLAGNIGSHITATPIRSPFPSTGTYKILCRGAKSWSPSTASVVVMGHDVNLRTEGGWMPSEVASRHE